METPLGLSVGNKVYDLLTESEATIVGIKYAEGNFGGLETSMGCWGYWLDNDWCSGARHGWEISKLQGGSDGKGKY